MTKLNDVISFIFSRDFTSNDHKAIASALKDSARIRQRVAKHQFAVGDRVEFSSEKRNMLVSGKVTKICRTTIHVEESTSGGFPAVIWRVSPTLLRKASPTAKEVHDFYTK